MRQKKIYRNYHEFRTSEVRISHCTFCGEKCRVSLTLKQMVRKEYTTCFKELLERTLTCYCISLPRTGNYSDSEECARNSMRNKIFFLFIEVGFFSGYINTYRLPKFCLHLNVLQKVG
jgi:hypothetical protein